MMLASYDIYHHFDHLLRSNPIPILLTYDNYNFYTGIGVENRTFTRNSYMEPMMSPNEDEMSASRSMKIIGELVVNFISIYGITRKNSVLNKLAFPAIKFIYPNIQRFEKKILCALF